MADFSSQGLPDMARRFGLGYMAFLADGWRRSWKIGTHYAGKALEDSAQAVLAPSGGQDLLTEFLNGWAGCTMEMATVPGAALAMAATHVERQAAPWQEPPQAVHTVDGKPLMLPLRFGNATQGWAAYAVDADKAQKFLGAYGDTFEVLQIAGQATLVIYAVDFRSTDLGPYREVGVEVWVRPKGNRWAFPGTVVVRMSVDEKFSIDGAKALFNFIKLYAPKMKPDYQAGRVTFPVDQDDRNTLAVTFPRFGRGRSTDVPVRYYTVDPATGAAWSVVFKRTTQQEGLQFEGNVEVRLGDATGKNCFCALPGGGGREACVCAALRDMGLPKTPMANGWTEQMSGHVEAPYAVTPGEAHKPRHAAHTRHE